MATFEEWVADGEQLICSLNAELVVEFAKRSESSSDNRVSGELEDLIHELSEYMRGVNIVSYFETLPSDLKVLVMQAALIGLIGVNLTTQQSFAEFLKTQPG